MSSLETVSVLVTDLVGSTSLASQVGPAVADELRREHFSILRGAIEDGDGREVKNLGDGLMVVFSSAGSALKCAVAMQQLMDRRNRDADQQLSVKMGIGLGDVTCEEDDYFGMAVVEASRLCSSATGGQILTTEVVRLMVGSRSEHQLSSVGELDLKGIPDPVPAFEVDWRPLDPESAALPVPHRLRDVPPIGYVGRDAERERLGALWQEARGGRHRLVLLSGDAGIGKTRLATHHGLAAHGEGATLLYGRCDEDLNVPYEAWAEALRHYVAAGPEEVLREHIERHGGALRRLVPELSERIPNAPAPQASDPETERYLLFGAVAGLLERASADQPVVLILDDLQWADKPTLSLLKHLASWSAEMRLLVLGAYREAGLSRSSPLSELLADLHRERNVERIALRGLEETDVVAIMEAAAGHEMDHTGLALGRELARETDGNPFFLAELLRHLSESGAIAQEAGGRWMLSTGLSELGLPQSVREVIGHRVKRLGDETGSVLAVAAVIGRTFDVDLLGAVAELGEDELLDRLDGAVEASVLAESPDMPGRFSFVQTLTNHTLYEDLGSTRRARLHHRIAEALEKKCGDDPGPHLAELAHHWSAARTAVDAVKALDYSRRAGERALEKLAPDEAIRWFEQALELHEQAGGEPTERCELLIGLGDAQRQAGNFDFRQTLLDAAALAQQIGDTDRLVRAALANARGVTSSFGFVDDERVAVLEAALERIPPDDTQRRARLLALLSVELNFSPDFERRLALSDESLALARQTGDPRTLAHVLVSRGVAIRAPNTVAERTGNVAELVELGEQLDDPVLRFWGAYLSAEASGERGDLDETDLQLERMHVLSEQIGQPTLRYFHLMESGCRTRMRGGLEEAEALADELGATGEPEALIFYTTQLAMLRIDQGRIEELVELLTGLMETAEGIPAIRSGMGLAQWELGNDDEARGLVQSVLDDEFAELPWDQAWTAGMTIWAEVAAHVGPPEAVRALYERLHPWRDQVAWNGLTTNGSVARYVGLLAAAMGRFDEAEEHFAAAAESHQRADAPTFLARTRLDWAQALIARGAPGDAERAREMLGQAVAAAREHGCTTLERRAAATLEAGVAAG